MSKIAIDIVLLPDSKMTNLAFDLSRRLSKKSNDKILLNRDSCLPHVSLAMGVMDNNDLQQVSGILQDLAARFKAFDLIANNFCGENIPSGEFVSLYKIKKTPELQSLHETVMARLSPYLSYTVSTGMLFSPPPVEGISLYWIENFLKKSSFKNFSPHITIGFGQLPGVKTPVAFTAPTLALCHLGNYCTCRKVLSSAALSN